MDSRSFQKFVNVRRKAAASAALALRFPAVESRDRIPPEGALIRLIPHVVLSLAPELALHSDPALR